MQIKPYRLSTDRLRQVWLPIIKVLEFWSHVCGGPHEVHMLGTLSSSAPASWRHPSADPAIPGCKIQDV